VITSQHLTIAILADPAIFDRGAAARQVSPVPGAMSTHGCGFAASNLHTVGCSTIKHKANSCQNGKSDQSS
jgi:hypothetical protein